MSYTHSERATRGIVKKMLLEAYERIPFETNNGVWKSMNGLRKIGAKHLK